MKRKIPIFLLTGLLLAQSVSASAAQLPLPGADNTDAQVLDPWAASADVQAKQAAQTGAEMPETAEISADDVQPEGTVSAEDVWPEATETEISAAPEAAETEIFSAPEAVETEISSAPEAAETEASSTPEMAETEISSAPETEEAEIIITPETEAEDGALLFEELDVLLAASPQTAAEGVKIDKNSFPDNTFRNYVTSHFDKNRDTFLSADELEAVTEINCSLLTPKIRDLKGIEYFTSLRTLNCSHNRLEALDLSSNAMLEVLDCSSNEVAETEHIAGTTADQVVSRTGLTDQLNIKENTRLKKLICSGSLLTSLDTSGNPALEELECFANSLTSLTLTGNPALTRLICFENSLSSLDISKCRSLKELECYYNQLESLDLSNNPQLQTVHCEFNWLNSLKVGSDPALRELYCQGQELYKEGNTLAHLDVSGASNLETLYCQNNGLTSLDVRGNPRLLNLYCFENSLSGLDVRRNTALKDLCCYGNRLKTLDVSANAALESLNCSNNQLTALYMPVDEVLYFIDCSYNQLTSLDVSALPNIQYVSCQNNCLSTLNVGKPSGLKQLDCSENRLTGLDLSGVAECDLEGNANQTIVYCYTQNAGAYAAQTDAGWEFDLARVMGSAAAQSAQVLLAPAGTVRSGSVLMFGKEVSLPIELSYSVDIGVPDCFSSEDAAGNVRMSVMMQLSQCPGHVYQEAVLKEADCVNAGRMGQRCTLCWGLKPGTVREIAAKGHSFGEYVTEKEPTLFAEGVSARTCSVCGARETKALAKLPGTIKLTVTSLPLQKGEKFSIQSLVTGMQPGDYIKACKVRDTDIATVNKKGIIRAAKTGTTKIAVKLASGVSAKFTLKVQDEKVRTTALSGLSKKLALTLGESFSLKPVVVPLTSQDAVQYASSDAKIVTVSPQGAVKGVGVGTARLRVQSGGQKFIIKVKVSRSAVQSITNVPAKGKLKVGKSYTLKPKLLPEGSAGALTYTSSDPSVATVSSGGKITAKKSGKTIITVQTGKISAVCKVTVK